MLRRRRVLAAAMTLLVAAVMGAPAALADPPPHAPAHGWRQKHDPYYGGYTGYRWHDDYGIREGLCDREIGRDMDRSDHACFGHSLELLDDGRRVHWDGARSGMRYTLTPENRFERDDRVCRRFTLVREYECRQITRRGSACRYGEGEWRMIDS